MNGVSYHEKQQVVSLFVVGVGEKKTAVSPTKAIATTNEAADTSEISKFAARHQKEYQKDIEFTVHPKEEGATLISVTLQTVFGKFKGIGTNQKIAKVNAVRMALEAWD